MTVHLVKLSAGTQSVDDLKDRIKRSIRARNASQKSARHVHVTRMRPKREAEILDGGSIYWVIKGFILARQTVVGLERRTGSDQVERTAIVMDPKIILTEPTPRRAFQGWRYLPVDDAPADLASGKGSIPPTLHRALAELGLL